MNNELKKDRKSKFLLNDSIEFTIQTNRPLFLKRIEVELSDNSTGDQVYYVDTTVTLYEYQKKIFFRSYKLNKIGSKTLICKIHIKDNSIIDKSFNFLVKGRPPKLDNDGHIEIPVPPKYNSSFAMYVHADGTKPLEYEWHKDGKKIKHKQEKILNFETLNESHFGTYHCLVKNRWSSEKSKPYKLKLGNDTSKPTINVIQPLNSLSPKHEIELKFEVIDESAIGEVMVDLTTVTESEGIYSERISLEEGENKIEIIARDDSPNKNRIVENITIIHDATAIDKKGPDIYLMEPNDSVIYRSSVIVKLNVYDHSEVDNVRINGEKVSSSNSSSVYSKLIILKKGKNKIPVIAHDKSENKNKNSFNFNLYYDDTSVIDKMKPYMRLISPEQIKDTVAKEKYHVKILAIDKSGIEWVKINGEIAKRIENRFERTINLELGKNNPVRVIAQDLSDEKNRDTTDIEIFRRTKPNSVNPSIDINTITPSTITIKWSKSRDSTFSKYKVYYSETEGVTEKNDLSCENTGINDTTCTLENLNSSTYYFIRVFVINKKDDSSGSKELRQKTDNSEPVFDSIDEQVGEEGRMLSFTVKATDPDKDDYLSYEMPKKLLPRGLENATFDRGKFSWKPGYKQAGSYEVIFVVKDTGDPVKKSTLKVDIKIKNTNQDPEFDATVNDTLDSVYVFQDYSDTVFAKDLDGDSVWFSLINCPSDMTIETVNRDSINKKGIIRWGSLENKGTFEFFVLAQDENNGLDTLEMTIIFPINFEFISSSTLPLEARSLVLYEGYAFIPGGRFNDTDTGGFCIYNIEDPSSPTLINSVLIDTVESFDMAISENVAYLVNKKGLLCYDISNIKSVIQLYGSEPMGEAESIVKAGEYVYISNSNPNGMSVFNVTNPKKIKLIDDYRTGSENTWDLEVSGEYAYISTDDRGLHIVDISSPSNCVPVGTYSRPGKIEDEEIVVDGNYAYLATYKVGFEIVDISEPKSPKPVVCYRDNTYYPYRITKYGNFVFLSYWGDGDMLKVFDISKPEKPRLRFTFKNSSYISRIIIRNGYAYWVSSGEFKIYRAFNL